jgi:hypothetical protein
MRRDARAALAAARGAAMQELGIVDIIVILLITSGPIKPAIIYAGLATNAGLGTLQPMAAH